MLRVSCMELYSAALSCMGDLAEGTISKRNCRQMQAMQAGAGAEMNARNNSRTYRINHLATDGH